MNINDDYISTIKKKLENQSDDELKSLVYRLIRERNELIESDRTDTLTGIYNRKILSSIDDFSGALMIDIDDFKSVNDTFGHDIGDVAIKEVANILEHSIRKADYVCRLGGDEFVIIFHSCPEFIIRKRADDIRSRVEDEINILDKSLNVSIGIAIRRNNETLKEIIRAADVALYESKEHGKNMITEFDCFDKGHKLLRSIDL